MMFSKCITMHVFLTIHTCTKHNIINYQYIPINQCTSLRNHLFINLHHYESHIYLIIISFHYLTITLGISLSITAFINYHASLGTPRTTTRTGTRGARRIPTPFGFQSLASNEVLSYGVTETPPPPTTPPSVSSSPSHPVSV